MRSNEQILVCRRTRLTGRISQRLERDSSFIVRIFNYLSAWSKYKLGDWIEMTCLSNKRKTVNSQEKLSSIPNAWMQTKVFDWPVSEQDSVFSLVVFVLILLMNPESIWMACFLFLFDFQDVTESSFLSGFKIIHLPYG